MTDHFRNLPFINILLESGGILAGGAILANELNIKPKDYDFFFTNLDNYNKCVEVLKVFIVKETPFAVTARVGDKVTIQLVRRIFMSNNDIMNDFDFGAVRGYADMANTHVTPEMQHDINNKVVTVLNPSKPLNSLRRLAKYNALQWDVSESYKLLVNLLVDLSPSQAFQFYYEEAEVIESEPSQVTHGSEDVPF